LGTLNNIPLRKYRKFLDAQGLKLIRTTGGHEVWSRTDLGRPVVLQTHIDPIPEFIVLNNLKTIGAEKKDLLEFLGH
jgi:predicted RNA binding protein YcfA (HicA-like mRNA interferase family)